VFDGPRITLQFIRDGRISFSAAAIAFAEATFSDERLKNRLCAPIPYVEHLITWPKAVLAELQNGETWSREPAMRAWARKHRLAGFTSGGTPSARLDSLRKRIAFLRPLAVENLSTLILKHESEDSLSSNFDRLSPVALAASGSQVRQQTHGLSR
jgi:hypothetical protein